MSGVGKNNATAENCILDFTVGIFAMILLLPLGVLLLKQLRRKRYMIQATKSLRFWIYMILTLLDLSIFVVHFFNLNTEKMSSISWILKLE
jgi:hypothetical protein